MKAWQAGLSGIAMGLGLLAASCSGGGPGSAQLKEGDPEIEHLEYAKTEMPDRVLVCGYNVLLEKPMVVRTYLDDDGVSVYDFVHDERQMRVWMEGRPGAKAYTFRKGAEGTKAAEIGRAVSEPCFGNGDQAREVVDQVIINDAPGPDASAALGALINQGRTTHFLIDLEGQVFQATDPVHAAFAPTDHGNHAIYITLVRPRTTTEWLTPLLTRPTILASALGALGAQAGSETATSLALPIDANALPTRCTANGVEVIGFAPNDPQLGALSHLYQVLQAEFPKLTREPLRGEDGAALKAYAEDSLRHQGVLADYQTSPSLTSPACLDLEAALKE